MHSEYKQQINGTRLLTGWKRLKAALDEQGRYAVSAYPGVRGRITVCCKNCGESEVKLVRSVLAGAFCKACKRSDDIIKFKAVLRKQDRTWLNEAEFTYLTPSMIHTRCNGCGEESTQKSGSIFYSKLGCPRCLTEKLSALRRADIIGGVRTTIARGKKKFERALSQQNRVMVGTYEQQKVKVSVKCLECGDTSDVLPINIICGCAGCQVCKSMRKKRKEEARKVINFSMNLRMADELDKQAESMHLTRTKYCEAIFNEWIESGKKMTLQEG